MSNVKAMRAPAVGDVYFVHFGFSTRRGKVVAVDDHSGVALVRVSLGLETTIPFSVLDKSCLIKAGKR